MCTYQHACLLREWTYQKNGEGGESNGAKPSDISIGDVGAKKRRKVGDTGPYIDHIRCVNLVHVKLCHQEDIKICQQPYCG